VQAEHSNHRKLRRSRAGVVSVAGEGPLSAGQVGDEKTNVCEPLLTHRKNRTMASKREVVKIRDHAGQAFIMHRVHRLD